MLLAGERKKECLGRRLPPIGELTALGKLNYFEL